MCKLCSLWFHLFEYFCRPNHISYVCWCEIYAMSRCPFCNGQVVRSFTNGDLHNFSFYWIQDYFTIYPKHLTRFSLRFCAVSAVTQYFILDIFCKISISTQLLCCFVWAKLTSARIRMNNFLFLFLFRFIKKISSKSNNNRNVQRSLHSSGWS